MFFIRSSAIIGAAVAAAIAIEPPRVSDREVASRSGRIRHAAFLIAQACLPCSSGCFNPNTGCHPGTASGACGNNGNDCQACGAGQTCYNQTCCTLATCSSQGASCGSVPDNCGGTLSCGTCSSPLTCINNQCGCSSGSLCNGSCRDLSSDPSNCGACGNVCTTSVANATPVCLGGTCTYECVYPYNDCGDGQCISQLCP